MGQINIRHHFYGALVFIFLVTAVVALMNQVTQGSDVGGDAANIIPEDEIVTFNNTFNVRSNYTSTVDELQTQMKGLKVENLADAITLPVAVIQTSWSMVKFLIGSFGFMDKAFQGVTGYLGVPNWVPTMIILAIVVMVIFAILSLIFGKDT